MIKASRNTMASAPRWRTESIGVHDHDWVSVGTDGQGEVYRVCTVCDARSNLKGARDKAQRQDWLEYREEWDDSAEKSAPPPPDPLSPKALTEAKAETHAGEWVVEGEDIEADAQPMRRGPGRPRKYP